jgi:hypothetical protein
LAAVSIGGSTAVFHPTTVAALVIALASLPVADLFSRLPGAQPVAPAVAAPAVKEQT